MDWCERSGQHSCTNSSAPLSSTIVLSAGHSLARVALVPLFAHEVTFTQGSFICLGKPVTRDHAPPTAFFLYYSPILFFFNDTATTEIYTLSLHDALPI